MHRFDEQSVSVTPAHLRKILDLTPKTSTKESGIASLNADEQLPDIFRHQRLFTWPMSLVLMCANGIFARLRSTETNDCSLSHNVPEKVPDDKRRNQEKQRGTLVIEPKSPGASASTSSARNSSCVGSVRAANGTLSILLDPCQLLRLTQFWVLVR